MFAKPKVKLRMRRKAWRPFNLGLINYIYKSAKLIHKIRKNDTLHNFTK